MPEILCPLCEVKFTFEPRIPVPARNTIATCPHCGWQFSASRQRFLVELARAIVQENIEELVGDDASEVAEDLLEDFGEDARSDLAEDLLTSPEIMSHLKHDPPTPVDESTRKRYRFITRTARGFVYFNPARPAHPPVGHITKISWSIEDLEEDLKETRETLEKLKKK